jgi:hypothetical protein
LLTFQETATRLLALALGRFHDRLGLRAAYAAAAETAIKNIETVSAIRRCAMLGLL